MTGNLYYLEILNLVSALERVLFSGIKLRMKDIGTKIMILLVVKIFKHIASFESFKLNMLNFHQFFWLR